MKNAPKAKVALSGFGGLDNPEPGIGVARALRLGWRGPLQIEALCYDAWATGGWVPGLADRLHLVPPVSQGDEAVLARLLAIRAKHPLDVVIPNLDLEVPIYSRLSRRLARGGIKTLLPAPESLSAVTKTALPSFGYANGIATPRSLYVAQVAEVPLYADRFGYPVMVKGTVAGARKVWTREQAYFEALALNMRWGGGVLLQEFIEGDEYDVAMVARGDESCLAMVPMRKLGINWRGKCVIGAVVNDPDLKRHALQVLKKLHWRGPLELEFMRSAADGRFYLIEVNNRFPAWILLSEFAGCNLPTLLLQEILAPGRPVVARPRAGKSYVRDVEEIAVPVDKFRKLQRFGNMGPGAPAPASRRRGRLRVAVTGISTFDLAMPGLGVARALRAAPEVGRLYGLAYGPYDTGLYRADSFDGGFLLSKDDDPEALLDRLLSIRSEAGLDAVIPCLDHELPRFIRIAGALDRAGIRTLVPPKASIARVRKQALFDRAPIADHGSFELPPTLPVRSIKDLAAAEARLGFPLMIKGTENSARAAYGMVDAQAIWESLRHEGHSMALAQPMIYGEEFGVAVLCDREHRLVDALVIKKLLPCDRGKVWGAIPVELPELVAGLGAFLGELGWVGPADVELIRDSVRERFVLIEINPRFPAWIGFSGSIGDNLPRQALRIAMGMAPQPTGRQRDLLFMRCCRELPIDAHVLGTFATKGEIRHV